jgi:hypothetical protein
MIKNTLILENNMRMRWLLPLLTVMTTPAFASTNADCEDEFYTWSYMSSAQSVCQFTAETNVIIKATGDQVQAHCKAVLTDVKTKHISAEALKVFHKDYADGRSSDFCKKTEARFTGQ